MADKRLLLVQHKQHKAKLAEIEADYALIEEKLEKMKRMTLDLHDKMNEVFLQATGKR